MNTLPLEYKMGLVQMQNAMCGSSYGMSDRSPLLMNLKGSSASKEMATHAARHVTDPDWPCMSVSVEQSVSILRTIFQFDRQSDSRSLSSQ